MMFSFGRRCSHHITPLSNGKYICEADCKQCLDRVSKWIEEGERVQSMNIGEYKIIFEEEKEMTQCTKQFDPAKPYRTRENGKAVILLTDLNGLVGHSIVARIEHMKMEQANEYYICGHHYMGDYGEHVDDELDLINISDAEAELQRVRRELNSMQNWVGNMSSTFAHQGPWYDLLRRIGNLTASLDK